MRRVLVRATDLQRHRGASGMLRPADAGLLSRKARGSFSWWVAPATSAATRHSLLDDARASQVDGLRRLLDRPSRAPLDCRWWRASLGDRKALSELFRSHQPRAVIHFAAKCYVGESVERPADYYLANVIHTWNLLEAMREAGCREIVFSSSCATYGEPRRDPHHRIPSAAPHQPLRPHQAPHGAHDAGLRSRLTAFGSPHCATSTRRAPAPTVAWERTTTPRPT